MPDRRDPVARVMHRGLLSMVRRGLRGVWLRGEIPGGPFVWAANHHSWWDPFLAAVLLDRYGRTPCLIILQENLEKYGFIRRLGVFGTAELRRGLAYLDEGRVLVIYPEGELRPAGPLGDLAGGAAWYARRAGAPLCAVATRVIARGHQAPEAYLSCAGVDGAGPVREVTQRLGRSLARELSYLDRLAVTSDPRQPLPGYRLVVRGRRSWEERIDTLPGRRPWRP
jgi:hypothetical protein